MSEDTTIDAVETDDVETDAVETTEDVWTPPSKEDWEKLNASATLARTEAANRRKWLKEHGIDPRTGKKLAPDVSPAENPDIKAALQRAEESDQKALRSLTAAVRRELRVAGVVADMVDLALPRIKLADLDIDDDGDIDGLTEQLDSLRTKFPTLFAPKEESVKKVTKSAVGTARKETSSKQPSFADMLRQSAGL